MASPKDPTCIYYAAINVRGKPLHKRARASTVTREPNRLVRSYLEAHRDELDIEDLDLAAFICVTTVESLTHDAVLDRPELLSGRNAQRLVDDVTRLVVRYLRK